MSKADINHKRVDVPTQLCDNSHSQLLASIVVKMLINDSCDLSYTLAKSFNFQLAGKNSYFLNSCAETKPQKSKEDL